MRNGSNTFFATFFALLALPIAIGITGCGAAGSSSSNNTPQKTTPTITWATPTAITYGTALSVTQLNATSSVAGSFVYTPAIGTVPAAGSQTLSAAFTPTDSATYNDATATVTLTVNKATPAITWPAPASIDSNTTLAGVLNATSTVAGSFAYMATPTGGTATAVTASSTLAAGSYTLTATLTPADANDYNTATTTVSLTVTQAKPTLTALSISSLYCEPQLCGKMFTVTVTGTGFQQGGTLSLTSWPTATLGAGPWGSQVNYSFYVNKTNRTPGWKTFQYCEPDGVTCSNGISFLLIGPNNTVTVDYKGGVLYNLDPNTGSVYTWTIDPSTGEIAATGSFLGIAEANGIAYDTNTKYVALTQSNTNQGLAAVGIFSNDAYLSSPNISGAAQGIATSNGEGCAGSLSGMLYCFDMTNNQFPYGQTAVDSPSAMTMGPIATATYPSVQSENDVLVVTRDGTPTLNKLNPNGANNPIPEAKLQLKGVTPISSLQPYTGGWYEALLGGTSGTLASADKLAIFVNAQGAMTEMSRTTFATPAYLLVSDPVHARFIVQVPDLTKPLTPTSGFEAIDPTTGKATPLNAKSSLFGGLAISKDGTKLYVCSGSQCEIQSNN